MILALRWNSSKNVSFGSKRVKESGIRLGALCKSLSLGYDECFLTGNCTVTSYKPWVISTTKIRILARNVLASQTKNRKPSLLRPSPLSRNGRDGIVLSLQRLHNYRNICPLSLRWKYLLILRRPCRQTIGISVTFSWRGMSNNSSYVKPPGLSISVTTFNWRPTTAPLHTLRNRLSKSLQQARSFTNPFFLTPILSFLRTILRCQIQILQPRVPTWLIFWRHGQICLPRSGKYPLLWIMLLFVMFSVWI